MSYMNHSEFALAGGIQELSFDEIDVIWGANTTANVLYTVAGTAGVVAAGASYVGAAPVAAVAAVVGLVAFIAAVAID